MRFRKPRSAPLKDAPRVAALHAAVAERPRIKAYLESERRIPFNEDGIFRRYPELDERRAAVHGPAWQRSVKRSGLVSRGPMRDASPS